MPNNRVLKASKLSWQHIRVLQKAPKAAAWSYFGRNKLRGKGLTAPIYFGNLSVKACANAIHSPFPFHLRPCAGLSELHEKHNESLDSFPEPSTSAFPS